MSVKGFKKYNAQGEFEGVEKYDYNSLDDIPFYKNTELVYEQEVTTKLSDSGTIMGGSAIKSFINETGVYYSVTVDDVLYQLLSKEFISSDGVVHRYVGNFMACNPLLLGYTEEELQQNGVVDTGESFCVVTATVLSTFYTVEAGTYQFKIEKITELKQIEEVFIPNTIARKSDIQQLVIDVLETLPTWQGGAY